ncbi:MAG: redoxin domain-containing protein [Planctomycetota bacterium]|jgi:peroxiredoxin (alkyl hydroperoxide reductase subunit C)
MSNDALTPRDTPIAVGDAAPDFTLSDQNKEQQTLSSMLASGPVVLSFYPFNFTGTCTTEMECLSADVARFKDQGITVVGVSCDSFASHKVFAEQNNLEITLLSDLHRNVCKAYGFYWPEMNVCSRGTVMINPDGTVAWVQAREVSKALSTDEILAQTV